MNFERAFCEDNDIVNTGDYVYMTYNYSFFEHLPGNREILEKRVKKVMRSVKENGQIRIPIVINDKAEIIDGQARVEAFERMHLPVYFTVTKGADLNTCIAVNKSTTIWSADDYLHSHAEQGNEDCIIVENYVKRYEGKVSKVAVGFVLTGNINAYNLKDLKNGKLKVNNSLFNVPDLVLMFLADLKPYFNKAKGVIKYAEVAMAFAYSIDGIDKERLANVIRDHYHEFPSYSNLEDWSNGITAIYNKGKKKGLINVWKSYTDYQNEKNGSLFKANEARRKMKKV